MTKSSIDHLTCVPWHLRWSAYWEEGTYSHFVVGPAGRAWFPAVATTAISVLLSFQGPKVWIVVLTTVLVTVLALSGLVGYGARKHSRLLKGISEVQELRDFLDWLHATIFSNNRNTRISVMVPIADGSGEVLKVFLRPSAFPSRSSTTLRIDGNTGKAEGAAGKCYCESTVTYVSTTVDSESDLDKYAEESFLTTDKVKTLKRPARYYMAHPIERPDGPPIGVLIFDNAKFDRLVDEDSQAATTRAERRAIIMVSWVARLLRAIPSEIRERA